eukprot:358490-Chlamydomonas_euryale.AAC.2
MAVALHNIEDDLGVARGAVCHGTHNPPLARSNNGRGCCYMQPYDPSLALRCAASASEYHSLWLPEGTSVDLSIGQCGRAVEIRAAISSTPAAPDT